MWNVDLQQYTGCCKEFDKSLSYSAEQPLRSLTVAKTHLNLRL